MKTVPTYPPTLEDLPPPPAGQTGWPWTTPDGGPGSDALEPLPGAGLGRPPISVVTPSFNQGQYLEETLRSVLLQGYPQLQYIVIDGGSTDASVDIIRKYAPWLAYWVSEPDRGQSHAINKGFARAQGEVLAWLNSDDMYLPAALNTIGASWEHNPEAALIYGRAHYMDQESVLTGEVLARPYDHQALLTETNFIPQASAFFHRAHVQALGGLNEALHYCMDYDLWLRLRPFGPAVFVPQPLSGMRTYPESKTGSADRRMFPEVRQMIESHGGHGLPAGFERWLLATRVPKAFAAFRQGNGLAGSEELGYIVQNVPAWQASSEPVVNEIVRQAWEQAPGLADEEQAILAFADLVCSHLPPEISVPDHVRRETFARLGERLVVRAYQRGDFATARRQALRIFRRDRRRVSKRWLWGTVVRSSIRLSIRPSRLAGRPNGSDLRQLVLASLPIEAPASAAGASQGSLITTCAMAASIGLLDGWDDIDSGARERWITQIQSAQETSSGLFLDHQRGDADPALAGPGHRYASWLTTYLALAGLTALGAAPRHPLGFAAALKSPVAVRQWLMSIDWQAPQYCVSFDWSHPWLSPSAQVMFLLNFLVREGAAFQASTEAVFDWLDDRQDPVSGFWGMSRGKHRIVNTIQAGHFGPLYLCHGRPLRQVARLVDRAISMQQGNALFSPPGAPSACAAQAGVDLLVKLSLITAYRAQTIETALGYASRALLRELKAQLASLSAGQDAAARARASSRAMEADNRWPANNPYASIWLNLSALALIDQRYPGAFQDEVRWQFPPPPAMGWHQASLLAAASTGN